MRVVPSHHYLLFSDYFKHLEHLSLVGWIDSLYTHRGLQLWHCEHIVDHYSVFVDILAHYDAHDFEWNARTTYTSSKLVISCLECV